MKNREIRQLLRTLPLVEPSSALDQKVERSLSVSVYQEFTDDLISWIFHRYQYVTMGVSIAIIAIIAVVMFPVSVHKEPVINYVQMDQVQQNMFCVKPENGDFFGNAKSDVMKLKIKRGGSLQ